MSDRLTLSRAIEDAGIERDKAERVASAIVDLIHDTVATKADVTAVRTDLKVDVAAVAADLRRTEVALKADVAAVAGDLRRTEVALKADIAAVRSDLTLLEHRMLIKLGALVFTAAGIVIAAIRYLPSVGHSG
jgi:3-oxoacyl-ACP reductase-like protein